MRRSSRLLPLLLTALALAPAASRGATALPGDANGDGKVTVADAQLALAAAVGLPVQLDRAAADIAPVNPNGTLGDGGITIADALAILRIAVGLDAAAGGSVPPGRPVVLPAVRFSIDTPRGSYAPEDAIPFTVHLLNDTQQEYVYTSLTGCPVDFSVADAAGNLVWQPTRICSDIARKVTLEPGQEQTWSFLWIMDPAADRAPRAAGTYQASARLKGTDLSASIAFQVAPVTQPVPLPSNGPVTFDLTPGHAAHYVNPTRGTEEAIRFERYAKQNGQTYTVVSKTPDGAGSEVLLRLDAGNELIQAGPNGETVRLKLNAKVGDTWTFEGIGSKAAVTLSSRSATLKTPGGIYDGLLQFDFAVGPDAGWTEWVHPNGFWVGYTRNTIAGPVDFRITNRDALGFEISNPAAYSAVLYPDFLALKPGDQAQLNLIVVDPSGHPTADPPGPVVWSADPRIGTVDANGLFTAESATDGVQGTVTATIASNGVKVAAQTTIAVGTVAPTFPPPGPGEGPTMPAPSGYSLDIQPRYAYPDPGQQVQFKATLVTGLGAAIPYQLQWWIDPGSDIGTITPDGLFTAGAIRGAAAPVYVKAVSNGAVLAQDYAKVLVGGTQTAPAPSPGPSERLAYLEGGSVVASIPPLASPDVAIEVDIAGSMPDPSWSYDRTDVSVNGDVIALKPILKQAAGAIVPAVLVPFTAKVFVHGLRSGRTYTVVTVGDDTKLTTTIKT